MGQAEKKILYGVSIELLESTLTLALFCQSKYS